MHIREFMIETPLNGTRLRWENRFHAMTSLQRAYSGSQSEYFTCRFQWHSPSVVSLVYLGWSSSDILAQLYVDGKRRSRHRKISQKRLDDTPVWGVLSQKSCMMREVVHSRHIVSSKHVDICERVHYPKGQHLGTGIGTRLSITISETATWLTWSSKSTNLSFSSPVKLSTNLE